MLLVYRVTSGIWGQLVPVVKVAQRSGWVPAGGSILWAQPKEERGSSDDANGRHGGSFEIIISNGYNKGASLPLDDIIRYRMLLELHHRDHNRR